MINVQDVADKADMIVNGYAFTKCELGYKVLNLNNTSKAMVISFDGEMLETTMDDIEVDIVKSIYNKVKEYLED